VFVKSDTLFFFTHLLFLFMTPGFPTRLTTLVALGFFLLSFSSIHAQVDADKMGAWYMYFFDVKSEKGAFGVQGDIQYRNWDLGGDLEQLLLRGGLTYRPANAKAKLTLGYGNITSGAFGESDATSGESRIYQEALLPHEVSKRIRLTHRFRYEQRFVENQDFRTRYRYNLFLTVPLSSKEMVDGTTYLSLYNELFINGQRSIGNDRSVSPKTKIQLGIMRQTTNSIAKNQVQLSLHQNF